MRYDEGEGAPDGGDAPAPEPAPEGGDGAM